MGGCCIYGDEPGCVDRSSADKGDDEGVGAAGDGDVAGAPEQELEPFGGDAVSVDGAGSGEAYTVSPRLRNWCRRKAKTGKPVVGLTTS